MEGRGDRPDQSSLKVLNIPAMHRCKGKIFFLPVTSFPSLLVFSHLFFPMHKAVLYTLSL